MAHVSVPLRGTTFLNYIADIAVICEFVSVPLRGTTFLNDGPNERNFNF